MVDHGEDVDAADWTRAQRLTKRAAYLSGVVGVLLLAPVMLGAMRLADAITTGVASDFIAVGFMCAILAPTTFLMVRLNVGRQQKTDQMVGSITQALAESVTKAELETGVRRRQARRQEFESRLANALDMADGEPEVIEVIERSLTSTLPESPVELLLADNSHAHLLRMASASPTDNAPGCGVDSPDRCPAARRAQVQRFGHSDDLDACPKLRGRPSGAVSAVCVPVSIMGRTVGVIHATAPPDVVFPEDKVQDLGTLAKLAGTRIGLLRAMAETQLQAATDSLTGLLNRRSFEDKLSAVRRAGSPVSIAMADLDHFKQLNDTHGHETGDRSLRLFAQVLTGCVRAQDLVCRHGGEEFAIAMISCTPESARKVMDGLRGRLDAAITVAGLPQFTVSIGIVDAIEQEELPTVIGRADAALFRAKRDGRDRVVVNDAMGNVVPCPDPDQLDLSAIGADSSR